MNAAALVVLSAFLQNSPSDKRAQLISLLPVADQEALSSLPPSYKDALHGFSTSEEQLGRIHFSYFAPYLRSLPKAEIALYFAALNEEQSRELKKTLLFSNGTLALSKLGIAFLRKELLEKVQERDLLPVECLPENPLNALLNLNSNALGRLITCLGIHDLKVEVKQIIETAKLKYINGVLKKEQSAYLKEIFHKGEAVTFAPMGLRNWNGDAAALQTSLRQRGLNRLAKALYGKHPSLLWHLSHKLDLAEGTALQKSCTPLDHEQAANLLTGEIIQLFNFLQKLEEP
jgi:hypothetical protein